MKFDIRALALTAGLLWGIGLFLITWWVIAFEGATGDPTWLGLIYRGYAISPVGSIIGLIWGFVDGLVCGAIFAWVYNRLAR